MMLTVPVVAIAFDQALRAFSELTVQLNSNQCLALERHQRATCPATLLSKFWEQTFEQSSKCVSSLCWMGGQYSFLEWKGGEGREKAEDSCSSSRG